MSGNQGFNSGGGDTPQPTRRRQPPPSDAPPAYYAPPPPPESPYPDATPPPYMQVPPPPPAKPKSGLRRLLPLIVLLIIGAVVVGGFVLFRDRAPNDVTSLALGECFDEPTVEAEISEVQRQPCNEAHDAEVIAVLTHPAPAGEPYPVVSGFDDYIAAELRARIRGLPGHRLGHGRRTTTSAISSRRCRAGAAATVASPATSAAATVQKMTNTVRAAGSSPHASQAAPSL